MAILKILEFPDPKLRKKALPVEAIDKNLLVRIDDMFETMYKYKGVGLAAPQVHINKQVMIFRVPEEEVERKNKPIEITALINPTISNLSEETDTQWEGCLSIPGMTGLVKRYSKIKYKNRNLIKSWKN